MKIQKYASNKVIGAFFRQKDNSSAYILGTLGNAENNY